MKWPVQYSGTSWRSESVRKKRCYKLNVILINFTIAIVSICKDCDHTTNNQTTEQSNDFETLTGDEIDKAGRT